MGVECLLRTSLSNRGTDVSLRLFEQLVNVFMSVSFRPLETRFMQTTAHFQASALRFRNELLLRLLEMFGGKSLRFLPFHI